MLSCAGILEINVRAIQFRGFNAFISLFVFLKSILSCRNRIKSLTTKTTIKLQQPKRWMEVKRV